MKQHIPIHSISLLIVLILAVGTISGCVVPTFSSAPPLATSAPLPRIGTVAAASNLPTATPLPATPLPVIPPTATPLTATPLPVITTVATLVRSPALTATVAATEGVATHRVEAGDTLYALSLRYGASIDELRIANNLEGDLIRVGELLVIPAAGKEPAVPSMNPAVPEEATQTATPMLSIGSPVPAILTGDLASAYPLTWESDRYRLHYTPNTLPAEQPEEVAALVQRGYEHLQRLLQRTLDGSFDAYAAGALFAAPDQALRGRSFSPQRRFFFLYDGSGAAWDQQYIVGHELTHLYAWNAIGAPSSTMLSEGLAVYAGAELVKDEGSLSLTEICLAYQRANALPWVAGTLAYRGNIRDMENYYAAGCFVQYLVETYGVDALTRLYPSGDYAGVYGKTLAALAGEWQETLAASPVVLTFDPVQFVAGAAAVKNGYTALFAAFQPDTESLARYAELDAARIALLEGRLNEVGVR